MPQSHKSIQKKYSDILPNDPKSPLFFSENFDQAGSNEQQSLRFMLVHLIDQSSQLQKATFRENWSKIIHDPTSRVAMYGLMAAGYNGSMKRVRDEAFGDIKKPLSFSQVQELLHQPEMLDRVAKNKETYTYVMKFAYVWNYMKEHYPKEFDEAKK